MEYLRCFFFQENLYHFDGKIYFCRNSVIQFENVYFKFYWNSIKRNILSILAVLRKLIFSVIRQRCCHQNRTLNQTAFLPGYVKYRDQCEACMFEQGTSKLSTRNKSEKVKKSFKPGELYVKSVHLYSLQMTTWFQWHSNITTSCLIYKKCYGPHLTKKGIFYLHIKIITIIQFYMKPTPYVYKNKAMVYIWYIMMTCKSKSYLLIT